MDSEEVKGATPQHTILNKTMKSIFSITALGLVAFASSISPASAQYFGTYNQVGNYGYGTVSGPSGYSMNYSRSKVGGFQNTTYSDNRGNTVNCNTSAIGRFSNTSCY